MPEVSSTVRFSHEEVCVIVRAHARTVIAQNLDVHFQFDGDCLATPPVGAEVRTVGLNVLDQTSLKRLITEQANRIASEDLRGAKSTCRVIQASGGKVTAVVEFEGKK